MKRIPVAVLALAVAAGCLLLLAGPGTRFGIWPYGTGLLILRWAFFMGAGAAALAIVLMCVPATRRIGRSTLPLALAIGLVAAWIPWNGYRTARALPAIHDITTDTHNPPVFVDIAPLRVDAPNSSVYGGEEIAVQQRNDYPDIQPLELAMPPLQAFDRALATARAQGWSIVAAVPEEGRIEATATTFWFGFKDDVVIRIGATVAGSRLDIRSESRVGRSDVGTNAARIREFVKRFKQF